MKTNHRRFGRFYCRWKTGFLNHCRLMMANWGDGETWSTSGNAEVALDPSDLILK